MAKKNKTGVNGAHAGKHSKMSKSLVNEPYAMYHTTPRNSSFVTHISNLHTIPANQKIAIIKNGVSKNELKEIKEESGLDYDTLSTILSVSRAKLINKKPSEKFDQSTSERIMLLADLIAYGQSVFLGRDIFNGWLKRNNKALGNKSPLNMMDTVYGIQEVKKEIGRIEYGVF